MAIVPAGALGRDWREEMRRVMRCWCFHGLCMSVLLASSCYMQLLSSLANHRSLLGWNGLSSLSRSMSPRRRNSGHHFCDDVPAQLPLQEEASMQAVKGSCQILRIGLDCSSRDAEDQDIGGFPGHFSRDCV